MLSIDLHDRVSFVTGAARGIGRACAEALAQAGAAIAVVDVDAGGAAQTASEIAGRYGVVARAYACDVRDPAAIRAAVDRAASEFGGLDHLVNNAGVQFVAPIADFPDDEYANVRAIDLDSVFYVTKAAWPHLVARERGRIVNVASVQGLDRLAVQDRVRCGEARRRRDDQSDRDRGRGASGSRRTRSVPAR